MSLTMFLSQAIRGGSEKGMESYVVWVGLMIVVVIVATGILMMYRRRVLSIQDANVSSGGLLDGLRGMRDRGEISVEEFETTRASMITKMSAEMKSEESAPDPVPRPRQQALKVAQPGFDLTGEPLPGSGQEPDGAE